MRVRWYEQAGVDYRADYWGSMLQVPRFEVYEWVESKDILVNYIEKVFNLDNYFVDLGYLIKRQTLTQTHITIG